MAEFKICPMELVHVLGICDLNTGSYVIFREKHGDAAGFLCYQLQSSKNSTQKLWP